MQAPLSLMLCDHVYQKSFHTIQRIRMILSFFGFPYNAVLAVVDRQFIVWERKMNNHFFWVHCELFLKWNFKNEFFRGVLRKSSSLSSISLRDHNPPTYLDKSNTISNQTMSEAKSEDDMTPEERLEWLRERVSSTTYTCMNVWMSLPLIRMAEATDDGSTDANHLCSCELVLIIFI